jgi:Zn-dependent peptidase ImmA (M78 family)
LNGETRHALRQFNLGMMRPGKIQSVSELAEWLKVDIHQVDLPIKFAGRLIADPFSDSGYAIEVNKRHSVVSRRFTVLHELGHFLLHVDRSDPLFEPMNLNRGDEEFYFEEKQEREANDFADVVMFGDGALEAAITLLNNDDVKVARYFGVSEAMVVVAKRKFRLGN